VEGEPALRGSKNCHSPRPSVNFCPNTVGMQCLMGPPIRHCTRLEGTFVAFTKSRAASHSAAGRSPPVCANAYRRPRCEAHESPASRSPPTRPIAGRAQAASIPTASSGGLARPASYSSVMPTSGHRLSHSHKDMHPPVIEDLWINIPKQAMYTQMGVLLHPKEWEKRRNRQPRLVPSAFDTKIIYTRIVTIL